MLSVAMVQRLLPVIALFMALGLSRVALAQDRAETEIRYLLDYVARSQCTFVRNGTAHDPADAADHLRLKYQRGSRYVNSAEQFVDRLASKSSLSGNPYMVNCGGRTEPTRDWLLRALTEYRQRMETTPGQPAATAG